jgi:hypothetical protein
VREATGQWASMGKAWLLEPFLPFPFTMTDVLYVLQSQSALLCPEPLVDIHPWQLPFVF